MENELWHTILKSSNGFYMRYISFMLTFFLLGCSPKEEITNLPYAELSRFPLPPVSGVYQIDTDKEAVGDMVRYAEFTHKPWNIVEASDDQETWKISKKKHRIKGEWYCLWWCGNQFYLKVKENGGKKRSAFVTFQIGSSMLSTRFSQHGSKP